MRVRGFVTRLVLAVLAGTAVVVAPPVLAKPHDEPRVDVLAVPGFQAVGTPTGLTPGWVANALAARGLPAELVAPQDVRRSDVVVNPYGQAYPTASAVSTALEAGAAWVNLAGVPFLLPDGTADATMPARYGVFAPPTPSGWFVGTRRSELGGALLPALARRVSDHVGWSLHASRPADERPLARYVDAAGIDGGPAITLILRPYRVVAVGFTGDGSPLAPRRPHAADLLAGLTRLAASTAPHITTASAERVGGLVRVTAAGHGRLTGTGTFPAPQRWAPDHPVTTYATVRLYRGNRLVDLVRLPTNAADVKVDGRTLLLNGKPFVVKGVEEEYGQFPPGIGAAEQAGIVRTDFSRMRAVGVNALRSYSYLSDWAIDAAARAGLLVMDALPFGTLTDARVAAALPWARFIGARGRMSPNLLIYSVGNETQDSGFGSPNVVTAQLAELTAAIRSTDLHTHPVTYAASEDEPWVLGSLPFLDVYGYNNYGATYPVAQDSTGFLLAQTIAQTIAGDRPMLITEWGVNATPTGQTRLASGSDLPGVSETQASAVYRKWSTLRSAGAVGGYYFEWSDKLVTGFPLPVPAYEQTLGAVEYPPGSGYHPTNEEDFWGLNDVYRQPRPALAGLRYSYTGTGPAPLPLPAP